MLLGDCLPFLVKSNIRTGLSSISADHERETEIMREKSEQCIRLCGCLTEKQNDREEE